MFKSPKKNKNYDGLYPGQSVGQFLKRKQHYQLSEKVKNISASKSAKKQNLDHLQTTAQIPKTSRWQRQPQQQLSKNLISAFSAEKEIKNTNINGRFAHKLSKEPKERKQSTNKHKVNNIQEFRNRKFLNQQFTNLNEKIEEYGSNTDNIIKIVHKIYLEGKMVFTFVKEKAQNEYIIKLAQDLGQRLRKIDSLSNRLNKKQINVDNVQKVVWSYLDNIEAELKKQFDDKFQREIQKLKSNHKAQLKELQQSHKFSQHFNNLSQRKISKLQQKLDQLHAQNEQKITQHQEQLMKSATMYEKQIQQKNQIIESLKKTIKQSNQQNAIQIKKIKDEYYKLESQRTKKQKQAKLQWEKKHDYFLQQMGRMKSTYEDMEFKHQQKYQTYEQQIKQLSTRLATGQLLIMKLQENQKRHMLSEIERQRQLQLLHQQNSELKYTNARKTQLAKEQIYLLSSAKKFVGQQKLAKKLFYY